MSETFLGDVWKLEDVGSGQKVIQAVKAEQPEIYIGVDSHNWNLVLQWPEKNESLSRDLGPIGTPAGPLMLNVAKSLDDYLRSIDEDEIAYSVANLAIDQALASDSYQELALKALIIMIGEEETDPEDFTLDYLLTSTFILCAGKILESIAQQGVESIYTTALSYHSEISLLQSKYDSFIENIGETVTKDFDYQRWFANERFGESSPHARVEHLAQLVEHTLIELKIEPNSDGPLGLGFSVSCGNGELPVHYTVDRNADWFFHDEVSGGEKPLIGLSNEGAMDFSHYVLVQYMIRSIARAKAEFDGHWSLPRMYRLMYQSKTLPSRAHWQPVQIKIFEFFFARTYWQLSYMFTRSMIRPEMAYPHHLHNEYVVQFESMFPKSPFLKAMKDDIEKLRWLPS